MSANRVYMWHQRRHTTGFPEAVSHQVKGSGVRPGKPAPLFDLAEVTGWYEKFQPWSAMKGRPSNNPSGASKQGKYHDGTNTKGNYENQHGERRRKGVAVRGRQASGG